MAEVIFTPEEIAGFPPGPEGPSGSPGPLAARSVLASLPAFPADAAPLISAALAAVDPDRGGDVYVTQGRYGLGAGLVSDVQGLRLLGEGMPGISNVQAQGSTQLVLTSNIIGIDLGGAAHQTRGYGLARLHLIGDGSTGTGIRIHDAEGSILEDITVSDLAVGLEIDGAPANAQYATLRNFRAANCMVGLKLTGPANGVRLEGGYFVGDTNDGRVGTGIHVVDGDTLRLFGTVLQNWETCVLLEKNAGHELVAARFEKFGTAIVVGDETRGFRLNGGCFVNGDVAVHVKAGARGVTLDPSHIENVTTPFVIDPGAEVEIRYS